MPHFLVKFCNDIPDSTGHDFHACQREIVVRDMTDEKQAVEVAKQEFEKRERIGDWRIHARIIECIEID